MPEIRLDRVSKKYPGKSIEYAVENVSYTVMDHEFVSLLGPSGCGKSTTLNMVAGLESVTEGSIAIDGTRVERLEPHKRDLAFVFQDYALYPHLNVYDNIAFGLRIRHMAKRDVAERVRIAAEKLELMPYLKKKPRELSGGQRQRVALARAIARRPGVLLFDEPLSNLDALLREKTRAELKILHADIGATSIYVTHDQEEAMSLSDKIAVMSKGRLQQYGTPDEVFSAPRTQFVAGFVGKPRMNLFDVRRLGRGEWCAEKGDFVVRGVDASVEEATLGLRPDECQLEVTASGKEDGRVLVVEPLGSYTDVTVGLGDMRFVARETGFSSIDVGAPVRIDSSRAVKHMFDRATGERILTS